MIYLTLFLKHWQYIVIAFLFVFVLFLSNKCTNLNKDIIEQKLKHSIEIHERNNKFQEAIIENLKIQNETERRINEVIEKYENTKSINTVKTETIIKEQLQPIINQFNSECFSSEWLSEQNNIIRILSDSNTDDK